MNQNGRSSDHVTNSDHVSSYKRVRRQQTTDEGIINKNNVANRSQRAEHAATEDNFTA